MIFSSIVVAELEVARSNVHKIQALCWQVNGEETWSFKLLIKNCLSVGAVKVSTFNARVLTPVSPKQTTYPDNTTCDERELSGELSATFNEFTSKQTTYPDNTTCDESELSATFKQVKQSEKCETSETSETSGYSETFKRVKQMKCFNN